MDKLQVTVTLGNMLYIIENALELMRNEENKAFYQQQIMDYNTGTLAFSFFVVSKLFLIVFFIYYVILNKMSTAISGALAT